MNAAQFKKAMLKAISYASERDDEDAAKSPKYAEDTDERILKRAQSVLTYLSVEFETSEPALHRALDEFLSLERLFAKADAARARNRQTAASETFSHPAPGAKA